MSVKLDEENIVNKEELKILDFFSISCPICSCVLEQPMICSNCENSFCSKCIKTWESKNSTCPICKNVGATFKESRIIKNILSLSKFKCDTCGKIFPYKDREFHLFGTCKFIKKIIGFNNQANSEEKVKPKEDKKNVDSKKIYYENGYYIGEFKDDMKNGEGICVYNNGDKFWGHFANDKREGFGLYQWADGEKYSGNWKEGKEHGEGEYFIPGEGWEKGTYEFGKLKK